jgi:hypothetical protein
MGRSIEEEQGKMPVKTSWHIRYACGHEADRDLSDLRPSERVGRVRVSADGDRPSCGAAEKRCADTEQWRQRRQAEQAVWERAAAMTALNGLEKAVAWAGQVRNQRLTAVYERINEAGHGDEAFEGDTARPTRQITSASCWIDRRNSSAADGAELVADAAADGQVSSGTENPH